MKTSEAQKRASEKYRLKHLEYYSQKSREYQARIRQERNEYKQRIEDAIEYVNTWICDEYSIAIRDPDDEHFCSTEPNAVDNLLNILEGKNGIVD